jgi:hypothetical protein
MTRMIALALLASSLRADPQDLLGKHLQDFAGKCKTKPARLQQCRVKGQPRYFGKIKISEEYLYFADDRVVAVKIIPDHNFSLFDFDELYGQPDRPLGGFEDRSA